MTSFFKRCSPLSPVRGIFDLLWIGSFALILGWQLLQPAAGVESGSGLSLTLREGSQTQGIYRKNRRLGSAHFSIQRRKQGWLLRDSFQIKGASAAEVQLILRQDLSLDRIVLDADLAQIGELVGAMGLISEALAGETRLKLQGHCELESGICAIKGKVGGRSVDLPLSAGRGPVVTAALYPLLVSGKLGNQVEVNVFEPLSMNLKQVIFKISGREMLKLGTKTYQAVKVQRTLAGLSSSIWLDQSGMILKEEMPLGFSLRHEAWSDKP